MAARIVRRTLESLPPLPPLAALAQMASGRPALVATSVALTGRVVSAVAHPEGILVVRMEDRRAKNMFSPELVSGLEEVFAHVAATPAYKVVVLSGFENYFASGGTRESLLAIQRGAAKFTDSTTFEAPLRCKVPVIAAMQGHGVGAGWVLGMLADFIIFSEESRYLSPYMDYGFTPGAGSTLVFPEKIGYDLARDTLLGALPYSGSDLRARGMGLPVEPQAQVQAAAMRLAQQLAQRPRAELIGLKQLFTHRLRQQLETTYASELTMHAATFVGREETLSLIRDRFVVADGVQREPATVSVDTDMPRAADSSATSVANGLKELLAAELQLSTERIGEDVQFIDLGLDSVSGVTWMRKINQRYGTSIEATKIYSHPTLRELGGYVSAQVGEERGLVRVPGVSVPVAAPSAVERVVARGAQRPLASRRAGRRSVERGVGVQSAAQPIAVIGLAGQFPGARDLQQYWENLAAGRDCVGEVPGERWDTGTYYRAGKAVAGKTNSRWLGALQEYDRFDPLFFNISPSEAQSMDPQQRLFLQTCWQGIEHAGYDARALSGSKCGVFVGCASGDYHQGSQRQRLSAQGFTGAANSILAARISYFLNLQGPCLAIDTACSSSLVAIANGCDSLRMGASDWVLAGGVYVMAGPEMHIRTAQAGMLSAQGRCFAFDQRADGFVPGEGVGVVVLKRLADAQRDGDTIYSVIRGWGVNQDGKTNGITAPNPAAQARLQQEVYERHGIDPGKIELLEAHGTGTQLGDPIEVQGLKESFGKYTRRQGYCALGSVKSNIGHCLTAAGVAGFIKLVLALRHRQLPPTIHFEKLNEHIELAGSPFYINSELREWHSSGDEPRQAAVSSFGFGGTNAHLVLQEHRAEPAVRWGAVRGEDAAMIVPLSARSAPQLRQRAADLLRFIQAPGQGVDLRELAYTLQVGRQAMEHRAAFTTPSLERLAAQLQDFLDGNGDSDGMFRGQAPQDKERLAFFNDDEDVNQVIVERWLAKRRHAKLAAAWAQGLDFDWNILHENQKPQRIALPLYPFAKDRYWIDQQSPTDPASVGSAAFLHPLVHVNMSDFDGQRYRSTFNGEEFFLADHQLRTQGATVEKVLPGVAYLEMVRVAVADALKQWPGSLELRDTVWVKPLAVSGSKDVFVALSAVLDEDSQEQLHYRVYSSSSSSSSSSEEVDHCKGRVTFCTEAPPTQIDLAGIRRAMNAAQLDGDEVYAALDDSGLHYGPAHRGVALIHCGEGQLLAQLRLPSLLESGAHDYVLHPSMMDSAIQSLMGLNGFLPQSSATPWVPFALEHVQVVAPCVTQMLAWARHSPGTRAGSGVTRVDIDLCDLEGNVRVLMRGFTLRKLDKPAAGAQSSGAFDGRFYESLIDRIVDKEISVEEAIGLE
jgi:acyl transferase domain-containing protein/enoyl-CoA hydratase/carnithine racemase/acyl carrier protein